MLADKPVNDTVSSRVSDAGTLLLWCPICGSDLGETEGLTGPMDGSVEGVVIMRCGNCSSVYLSPSRNMLGGTPPSPSKSVLSTKRIRQWARGLPSNARILCLDCESEQQLDAFRHVGGSSWVLDGSEGDVGDYDLIVLPHSLESAQRPEEFLRHIRSLLSPGGRVIVMVSNLDSSLYRVFGGRHWCGYDFPRTRQHFNANSLDRLCGNADLSIRKVTTLPVSRCWLSSTKNWLRDWKVAEGWVQFVTGLWLVPQALASVIEGIAQMRGRGSLLVAELERE